MSDYFHEYDTRGKSFGVTLIGWLAAQWRAKLEGAWSEKEREHNEGDKWGPNTKREGFAAVLR